METAQSILNKVNPLALLKVLAAAATTQDEQLLRRAARMEENRNEVCRELRANMMRSEAYTKMSLAEAKYYGKAVSEKLAKLDESSAQSSEATENYLQLRRNQAALEILDTHKSAWNQVIRDWLSAAHGIDPTVDSDNPDTMTLAKLTADFLALGEKEATSHSTAVILYHPREPITEFLKVAYATGEGGMTTSKVIRRHAKVQTPVEAAVWDVIESGNPRLANPFNHPEVAASAVSIVPLTSITGHRFGVIVSGPPALPDELLASFASTAGQMFERIGKLELIWSIIGLVQTFVEKQCQSMNKLVYVRFTKDKEATAPRDEWDWQPLEHTHPRNDKLFELPLSWKGGELIGLFSVECSTFSPMDEQLIVLTHTVADILLDAVTKVEKAELGTEVPLCTPVAITREYERRREGIADQLAGELSRCIKVSLTFYNSIIEATAYCDKVDDEGTKKLLKALVTLAGINCKGWDAVRKELKKPKNLVDELANVSMLTDSIAKGAEKLSVVTIEGSGKGKKAGNKKAGRKNASRWNLAEAVIAGLDIEQLTSSSPIPVRILVRWLLASQKVYHIGVAMASRTEEAENPLVQRMFETIDTDRSGFVSIDELVKLLVNEHGPNSAMRFLRVIDANADGLVSRIEWHQSWRNGQFDVDASQSEAVGPSGLRLLSRHLSSPELKKSSQREESSKKKKLKPIKKGTSKYQDRVAPEPEDELKQKEGAPSPEALSLA